MVKPGKSLKKFHGKSFYSMHHPTLYGRAIRISSAGRGLESDRPAGGATKEGPVEALGILQDQNTTTTGKRRGGGYAWQGK